MSLLIQLQQVTKAYSVSGRSVTALNQINLSVHEGEWVTVMGQAKSGKSSLIHVLGLLDPITAGEYYYASEPLSAWPLKKRHAMRDVQFGFLFPFPHLLPHVDVLGNVLLPLYYRGTSREIAEEQARDAIELVSLTESIHALPHTLSQEEQQRVAIARTLAHQPAVLLVDDPTACLKDQAAENIINLLKTLHTTLKQTLIMVTQPREMPALPGRIFQLEAGSLVS